MRQEENDMSMEEILSSIRKYVTNDTDSEARVAPKPAPGSGSEVIQPGQPSQVRQASANASKSNEGIIDLTNALADSAGPEAPKTQPAPQPYAGPQQAVHSPSQPIPAPQGFPPQGQGFYPTQQQATPYPPQGTPPASFAQGPSRNPYVSPAPSPNYAPPSGYGPGSPTGYVAAGAQASPAPRPGTFVPQPQQRPGAPMPQQQMRPNPAQQMPMAGNGFPQPRQGYPSPTGMPNSMREGGPSSQDSLSPYDLGGARASGLVSGKAIADSASAINQLSDIMAKAASGDELSQKQMNDSGITINQLISEISRPVIKMWLDNNLPQMVEAIVSKEVDRIKKSLEYRNGTF